MSTDEERAQRRAAWNRMFAENVPHNVALGIQVVDLAGEVAHFRLPYAEHLIGNAQTGVLHGGAITALLDACSGAAVFGAVARPVPIATLDLRIDWMRPGEVGRDILARATCYRLTHNVAFTRAVAYHEDPDDPIATSVGTFMLSTKSGKARP